LGWRCYGGAIGGHQLGCAQHQPHGRRCRHFIAADRDVVYVSSPLAERQHSIAITDTSATDVAAFVVLG
jgi:hypothetical protein